MRASHGDSGRLLERYHRETLAQQAVVNLLAVSLGGLNKTQIVNALRKIIGKNEIDNIDLDSLKRSGLLEADIASWSNQRVRCNRWIVDMVARELVAKGEFDRYVSPVRMAAPLQKSHYARQESDYLFTNDDELVREVRIGIYQRDHAYIKRLFDMLERQRNSFWGGVAQRWIDPTAIYAVVCDNPFDRAWFMTLPEAIREEALPVVLLRQLAGWRLDAVAFALLRDACTATDSTVTENWLLCFTLISIFKGDLAIAQAALSRCQTGFRERAYHALIALLKGDIDNALLQYREALALWHAQQNVSGKRKPFLPGVTGLFFIIALFLRNQTGDMEEARRLLNTVPDSHSFSTTCQLLGFVPDLERNDADALNRLNSGFNNAIIQSRIDPWFYWLGLWVLYQYGSRDSVIQYLPQADEFRARAEESGYAWLAAEMAVLMKRIDPQSSDWQQSAAAFEQNRGFKLLIGRARIEEPWERALNAIRNTVAPKMASKRDAAATYRLAWLLHRDGSSFLGFSLEAREQKRAANGEWQKGKPLSLKKITEIAKTTDYFSDQDRRVASYIAPNRATARYDLTHRGWLALAGAPNVAWRDSGIAVELIVAEPELRINKKAGDQVKIEFWPLCDIEENIVLAEDGLTRVKVIELKPEHHRLAQIVGKGINAPQSAQERILTSLSAVSSLVTIHSDIGGADFIMAETVPSDANPYVQLIPEGEGLRVAVLVRPFDGKGSYYIPGSGGTSLIAEIDGKRMQTQRDLLLERKLANGIVTACPSLSTLALPVTPFVWTLEDAQSSLEFLLELRETGSQARIEWPQGEKFKVLGQARLGQFNLRVKQQRDWFSVGGELKLDDGMVLSMQTLLELTENAHGKFIRLDEGRFIALTEAFRKRLDDLRAYSEKHGKDQRVHALALPVLDEIAGEVGEFEADAAWQAQLQRLRAAEQAQPQLPSTLQAELRDYQRDGYDWLYRLSAWGVGACLADDMGLGKTLQALAVILSRAGDGPTLVIAPTSVCMNWQSEAQRFAPTLNVHLLGDGNRKAMIESLRPMDLLICSYALLQQDTVGQLLTATTWQTIVLDEAQMIKNPATKRSRQAMALQGGFKIITTGTPVENHLGELWNLFRFINPGLLGSLESFNRRFAAPIERNQDRDAKQRLKRMIQPFILRRTKAQVLSELPPCTEIELHVELSEQEMAFYEALRRKLLKEIDKTQGIEENKRFQVLAAITKLRRACCNPELVAPELGLPSSKLALFGDTLSELLDSRHKTLVFSQFVDHLGLIRAYLDEKGIGYQYLDGQTPASERKKRIDAFQAGQGDVFLISLKAGGVGLNLTAADYVIHMDPWWNPAVEDQASGRAHRIGQQRPVTVYRLVTKNTIEQQIVSLHRHKRDLADSVLEGGEMSGKISAQELLDLIRN